MVLIKSYEKNNQRRCSVEKGVLKKFRQFHRKTLVLESHFNKCLLKIGSNAGVFQ